MFRVKEVFLPDFNTECFFSVFLFMSFVDFDCDVSPFSKFSSAFVF